MVQQKNRVMNVQHVVSITDGSNTDVIEFDAASNSRVEEMRDIIEKVRFAPSNARYKVYIIDEVHMLSTSAFNALLKTLEEPPSHVVFILATTEPHKIPLTIISRCQRFDFKPITSHDIMDRMKEVLLILVLSMMKVLKSYCTSSCRWNA